MTIVQILRQPNGTVVRYTICGRFLYYTYLTCNSPIFFLVQPPTIRPFPQHQPSPIAHLQIQRLTYTVVILHHNRPSH